MVYPFARLTKGATTILAESPCSCPSLMKALATLAKGTKAGSMSPPERDHAPPAPVTGSGAGCTQIKHRIFTPHLTLYQK